MKGVKKKRRSTLVEGCYLCWEQVAEKNWLTQFLGGRGGADTTAMATEHRFQTIYVQSFSTFIASFSTFLHLFFQVQHVLSIGTSFCE